jgi:hypothetical protein
MRGELRLESAGQSLVVPVGAPVRACGGNRLELTVQGRPVEVAVSRLGCSQPRLARDLAAFLQGDLHDLRPAAYTFTWPVLVALAPLAIPLLMGGGWWWLLGAGLGALGCVLVRLERWPLARRERLVLALDGLGGLLVLAALLSKPSAEAPADPTRRVVAPGTAVLPGGRRLGLRPTPRQVVRQGRRQVPQLPPALRPPAQKPYLVRRGDSTLRGNTDLRFVKRILPWLTLTVDTQRGAAFSTSAAGELRHYSYPDFHLRGSYRLGWSAYQAQLDTQRGALHLGACPPGELRLDALGERMRATGTLLRYDLEPLLAGRFQPGTLLRPEAQFRVGWEVRTLLLSPDQQYLSLLAATTKGLQLRRFRMGTRQQPAILERAGRASSLHQSPDGKFLYLNSLGHVVVFRANPLRIHHRAIPVLGTSGAFEVGRDGRIFVADHGAGGIVAVQDLDTGQVLGRFQVPLRGRIFLRLAPDGRRLFVGNSSVTGGGICSLLVAGRRATRPLLLGEAVTDGAGAVRGENVVTPDGRFLLNRAGKVFRLLQTIPAGG